MRLMLNRANANSQRPIPNSHDEGSQDGLGTLEVRRWELGVVTAALLLSAVPALAQMPDPSKAINAAKNARTATEAAQKKNSEALDPSPAQGRAPQTPAEKPPQGAPGAPGAQGASGAAGASGAGYTYEPAGRRDPFVSLLGRGGDVPAGATRPQGLAGLLINEMTLKGVMRTPKGDFVALLQAPDNKSFIGHAGDKVLDGAIKTITAGEVVFTQDVNDPLSLVKQREVRKAIRPEAR